MDLLSSLNYKESQNDSTASLKSKRQWIDGRLRKRPYAADDDLESSSDRCPSQSHSPLCRDCIKAGGGHTANSAEGVGSRKFGSHSRNSISSRLSSTAQRTWRRRWAPSADQRMGCRFLCTVELQEAKGRIRAVIFGPPIRDKTKAAGLPFIFKQVTSPCSGVGVNALGRVWHECPSPPLPFPWKPQPDIEAKHLYTVEQLKNLDDSGRPKGGYSPPYTRTRQEPISAKCIG
jgi:hypothetical protein